MMKTISTLGAAALACLTMAGAAQAENPYVGEIKSFGFNFCPQGWAALDGQLLAVSSNDALFSLLGTTYGGDGRTTFGLPDLRGRVPLQAGNGPGLSTRVLGNSAGTETETQTINTMPAHSHTLTGRLDHHLVGSSDATTDNSPAGHYLGTFTNNFNAYTTTMTAGLSAMGAGSVHVDGSDVAVAHNGNGFSQTNMAPYLVTKYCISLYGVYPSRN
ncbi:MAG: phage tail protein [Thalassovita sp.]